MKKIKKWLVAFTMLLTLAIGIGALTSCDKITTWIDSKNADVNVYSVCKCSRD